MRTLYCKHCDKVKTFDHLRNIHPKPWKKNLHHRHRVVITAHGWSCEDCADIDSELRKKHDEKN